MIFAAAVLLLELFRPHSFSTVMELDYDTPFSYRPINKRMSVMQQPQPQLSSVEHHLSLGDLAMNSPTIPVAAPTRRRSSMFPQSDQAKALNRLSLPDDVTRLRSRRLSFANMQFGPLPPPAKVMSQHGGRESLSSTSSESGMDDFGSSESGATASSVVDAASSSTAESSPHIGGVDALKARRKSGAVAARTLWVPPPQRRSKHDSEDTPNASFKMWERMQVQRFRSRANGGGRR